MMSFRNERLHNMNVPMRVVRLISKINEYKGKQDLFFQQSPQILDALKEVAIIQSTEASNKIEGIVIKQERLNRIIKDKNTDLTNRSEGEIAGYRDVLDTIHSSHEAIDIKSNVILQLHRDLYKFVPADGGRWKNSDNIIEEKLSDGTKFIRFRAVSAFDTPGAMQELCDYLNRSEQLNDIDPLILIGAFVLDLLCIHPFNDGNGRMARLLTLLLLYKFGYEVGRFISLEKIIEDSKESYYDTLYKSSQGWHESEHNLIFWLEYFLGIIVAAYKQFEERVGIIDKERGSKSTRVENAIGHFIAEFTKDDIRNVCPDVGESTINRVLSNLKDQNKIMPMGKGRNAKWKKI